MHMFRSRTSSAAFLAVIALAACGGGTSTSSGGSSSSSSSGGGNQVVIGASGLAFTGSSFSAKAGEVAIELDNNDPVEHNVTLDDGDRLLVEAGPKKSATAKVTLAAGTYHVHCSVPGHNMHATITVQ